MNPVLSPEAMTGVQRHAQVIVREIDRLQQEADRMTRLCQSQQAELVDARRKLHAVATLKSWVNEDGKRFIFCEDLAEALGLLVEATA